MSGRTAIDMQARTLTYFIAGQAPLGAPSGPLALNRPRYWQVAGNILTLTTRGDDGQPLSVARWQKSTAHTPMNGRVDFADSVQEAGIVGGRKRRHQVRAEDIHVAGSRKLVPQLLQPDRCVQSAVLHQKCGAFSARSQVGMVVR